MAYPVIIFSELPAKYLFESTVPNPNLTWKKTKDFNIGRNANLYKGLVGFCVDVFQKNTYDIYAARLNQYPLVYGASFPSVNYGKVDVQRFEFLLKHQYHINDFKYSFSGNVSFNRNRAEGIDFTPDIEPWNNPIGKPINYTTGYTALGLYQSDKKASLAPRPEETNPKAGDIKYSDQNKDGIIVQRNVSIIQWHGNTPEIMYGLTLNASWKGFDLNVFCRMPQTELCF